MGSYSYLKKNIGRWFITYVDVTGICDRWLEMGCHGDIFSEDNLKTLGYFNENYGMNFYIYTVYKGGISSCNHILKKCKKELYDIRRYAWLIEKEYIPDNVNIDLCSDESIKSAGQSFQDRINKIFLNEPYKKLFSISLKIDLFTNNKQTIEDCLEKFFSCERELYISAGVLAEDKYYFVDSITECLYVLDINDGIITDHFFFPNKGVGASIFKDFVYRNGKIWMFPCKGESIFIFDISKQCFLRLPLPYSFKEMGNVEKYTGLISEGRFVWFTPTCSHVLIKIDMDEISYEVIDKWPDGIYFENKIENVDFHTMCNISGREIVLTRGRSEYDVVVDKKTNAMRKIFLPLLRKYCYIDDGKVYVVPTNESDNSFFVTDIDTGVKSEYEVPKENRQEVSGYYYKEITKWDDKIWIFPYTSKKAMIFDLKKGNLRFVNITYRDFRSIPENKFFVCKESYKCKNSLMLVSQNGNQIILLDNEGNITRVIFPKIELGKIEILQNIEEFEDNKIKTETGSAALKNYIEVIAITSKCKDITYRSGGPEE